MRFSPQRLLGLALTQYTRRTPIPRGRDRLALIAAKLGVSLDGTVRSRSGHNVQVDFEEFFYRHAFFTGEYEPGITRVLAAVLERGNTCIDVGANIGWHCLMMAKTVSTLNDTTPLVHAFEPLTASWNLLKSNIENNRYENLVTANQIAVTDAEGSVFILKLDNLPATHAMIDECENRGTRERVPSTTIDNYMHQTGCDKPDFIKIDVEGAELMVVRGAKKTLSGRRPPVLCVEAAAATSKHFNYTPNILLDQIRGYCDYEFFHIHEASGNLTRFYSFADSHIGANILAVPSARPELVEKPKLLKLITKGSASVVDGVLT